MQGDVIRERAQRVCSMAALSAATTVRPGLTRNGRRSTARLPTTVSEPKCPVLDMGDTKSRWNDGRPRWTPLSDHLILAYLNGRGVRRWERHQKHRDLGGTLECTVTRLRTTAASDETAPQFCAIGDDRHVTRWAIKTAIGHDRCRTHVVDRARWLSARYGGSEQETEKHSTLTRDHSR